MSRDVGRLLPDFISTGLLRYIRRLLRIKHLPEPTELEAMLNAARLEIVAEGRVRSQTSALSIVHTP